MTGWRGAPAVGDLVDLVLLEVLSLGELERVKGTARVAELGRPLHEGAPATVNRNAVRG